MPLPEKDPYQVRDSTVKYYAYRYPKLSRFLNIALCPVTCGCFYCWTTPFDQVASDMAYNGLPVHKRMADMHFAREGRKLNRRKSLSDQQSAARLTRMFESKKRLSNQADSPLFSKLPFEIRVAIFKYVLFDTGAMFVDTARINPDDWNSFDAIQTQACELDSRSLNEFSDLKSIDPGLRVNPSQLSLALLQTCRRVYAEALPVLYSQTQFVFKEPRHLVSFYHSVPATHFTHIRSIRMDFSKMSNFREYNRELSKFVHYHTFVTPLRRPMEEYFRVLRSMARLRSIYITFKIMAKVHNSTSELRLSQADFEEMLKEMQEYHKRTRDASTTLCTVHLLVYHRKKLVCQKSERGTIDLAKPVGIDDPDAIELR